MELRLKTGPIELHRDYCNGDQKATRIVPVVISRIVVEDV